MPTCGCHGTGVLDAKGEGVEVNVPRVCLIGGLVEALEVNGDGCGGGRHELGKSDGAVDPLLVEGRRYRQC